jgi:hypothetical protein
MGARNRWQAMTPEELMLEQQQVSSAEFDARENPDLNLDPEYGSGYGWYEEKINRILSRD